MNDLRKKVIRLANAKPELRPVLLPLIKEGGDLSKLPPALREQAEKKQEEAKEKKDKKAATGTLIADNNAIYSWEYTYIERKASVYDNNGNLSLVITEFKENSGLRPYSRTDTLENVSIGTLAKPDLRKVVTLLKQYNFQRSSAERGFKRKWSDPKGREDSLGNLIRAYSATAPSAVAQDAAKRKEIERKLQGLSGADLDRILQML